MHTLEFWPLRQQANESGLVQVLLHASPCKAVPCRALGSVAWFPVHCTSINNTNQLISGDNKGVASQLMEVWARTHVSGTDAEVGAGLVAAFGQSNVGDTSPNTEGTFCMDTGGLAVSPLQGVCDDRRPTARAPCALTQVGLVCAPHMVLCAPMACHLKLNNGHPSEWSQWACFVFTFLCHLNHIGSACKQLRRGAQAGLHFTSMPQLGFTLPEHSLRHNMQPPCCLQACPVTLSTACAADATRCVLGAAPPSLTTSRVTRSLPPARRPRPRSCC